MRGVDRHRLLVLGLASSALSLFVSLFAVPFMLPVSTRGTDEQLALLYKVAQRDVPRVGMSTSTRAIVVDLDQMQLQLVDNQKVQSTIKILSRGRPETFWETPTGNYQVHTKEVNHFSSIGSVWMPYSMQFFGNFFIHGWPYHEDGTPVPAGYSGGCIRLATEDAAQVYAFASIGTPVYIRGAVPASTATSTFVYYLRGEGLPPEISAGSFIVADLDTSQVLWERKAHVAYPARGLTALMSGVIALETVNQYKTVRMSELILGKAIPRETKGNFPDELPIGALIYPLMFDGNDTAAKAFAADHGERSFVRRMNEKAQAIGMQNTQFASSTGSITNLSTVNDLFILLRHISENKAFLINASTQSSHVIHDSDGDTVRFRWENKFYQHASTTNYRGGLLTKFDSQKGEAAVIYRLPLQEFGDRNIAVVMLDSKDPEGDTNNIIDFVSKHFVYAPESVGFAAVVREPDEPVPSLWGKINSILHLNFLLNNGNEV